MFHQTVQRAVEQRDFDVRDFSEEGRPQRPALGGDSCPHPDRGCVREQTQEIQVQEQQHRQVRTSHSC